jgi:cytochrome b561
MITARSMVSCVVFVAMVASLMDYHLLLSIHRPLGIAVLILVVVRFANRKMSTLPNFPSTMSHIERQVAKMSEYLMYALMLVLPLVGWGMLSAANYPIVLFGSVYLPWILPHNLRFHWELRQTHRVLAYLFFAKFVAALRGDSVPHIDGDGLLGRMVAWNLDGPVKSHSAEPQP